MSIRNAARWTLGECSLNCVSLVKTIFKVSDQILSD